MIIRQAKSEDISNLATIRKEAILKLAMKAMGEEGASQWPNPAPLERVQLAIKEHDVHVAEVKEQVVGWIEFANNQIAGLYVMPELSRGGVGSTLLAYAEKMICSAGYPSIILSASLNAEPFYINRGYRPTSERSLLHGLPMEKVFASTQP